MRRIDLIPIKGAVLVLAALFGTASALAQSLTLTRAFDLPAVAGRIDHLDIDLEGSRLFIAALAAGSLDVVDLASGRRIARFMPLSQPQGVTYLSARHRVVIASGGTGRVDAYETAPSAVASISRLDDADNIRFDARSDRLFVGYGRALAVLDSRTLAVTQTIELPGHPEAFELEPSGRRVFVNVPSAGQIVVVDRQSATIASTWPVTHASGNFPMALDATSDRLHITTRRPSLLQAYETTTGKRVAEVPICDDADDLFFDARRQQLYVVCGQGVVDIVHWHATDRYEVVAQVRTAPGARTGLFVPSLSTLFVAVPARAGEVAQIRVYSIK